MLCFAFLKIKVYIIFKEFMSQSAQKLVATLLSIRELQNESKESTHKVRKTLEECTGVLFSEVESMGGRVRLKDGGLLYINNRSHAKRISNDDLRNCILAPQLVDDSSSEESEEDDKCSSHSGVTVLRGKRKRSDSGEHTPLDKLCNRVLKMLEQRMFPVSHFLDYSKPTKRPREDSVESTEWIEQAHSQREDMRTEISNVRTSYLQKIRPLKHTSNELMQTSIEHVKELGGKVSYTLVHPETKNQKYTTLTYKTSKSQGRMPTKREMKNICFDAVSDAVSHARGKKDDPEAAWQSASVKNKAIDTIIAEIRKIKDSTIVTKEAVSLRGYK